MTGQGKTRGKALVTGASRGIGRAVAEALVRRGFEVIGTCRDPKKIPREEVLPGVTYLPLDLASARSIETLVRRVRAVDLLVNSAGSSMIGPVEEVRTDRAHTLFEVNFFGPLLLTQRLLRPMRENGKGMVIFIGSMHSETSVPYSSLYAASKSALRSLAGTLRAEVRELGIRVTVLAPFHIRTELAQERQYRPDSPYLASVKRVKEQRDIGIARAPSPRVVAGKVLQVLEDPSPRPFYPVGKMAEIQWLLLRHLPRRIVDAIVRRMYHTDPEV
jgi:short-subunit dehydrogenase